MATVLSGTSGALYYKPAGTSATTLANTAFPSSGANITVGTYLGFQVNDPVTLAYPAGESTSGIIAAGDYYVKTYAADTGIITLSSSVGGAAVTASAQPVYTTKDGSLAYKEFEAVGNVREWSFEVTRDEIDVTSIGQTAGQYAPFKTFITGFADGSGSASVYFTDDDTDKANRLIEDVIQNSQSGTAFRLYLDKLGSEALSRSIEFNAVLTSASFSVNPDDAQVVEVAFRPSAAPTFDFSKS